MSDCDMTALAAFFLGCSCGMQYAALVQWWKRRQALREGQL